MVSNDFLSCPCLGIQGSGGQPSAPPFQSGSSSSGPVKYPDVFQPSEEAAEKKTNKDFWSQNLGETGKEQGRNAGFWGDALGGDPPAAAPKKDNPYQEAAKEASR